MDEQEFKDRCKRLKEVNKVITDLDPAIRESAYSTLEQYVTGKPSQRQKAPKDDPDAKDGEQKDTSNLGRDKFIRAHHNKDDKPSDNVLLIAASHFREYGSEPLSYKEVDKIAANAGLTIPERLPMTFKQAKKAGKKTFKSAGRGKVCPTVHGEKRLKETYNITKGTKRKPTEDND